MDSALRRRIQRANVWKLMKTRRSCEDVVPNSVPTIHAKLLWTGGDTMMWRIHGIRVMEAFSEGKFVKAGENESFLVGHSGQVHRSCASRVGS